MLSLIQFPIGAKAQNCALVNGKTSRFLPLGVAHGPSIIKPICYWPLKSCSPPPPPHTHSLTPSLPLSFSTLMIHNHHSKPSSTSITLYGLSQLGVEEIVKGRNGERKKGREKEREMGNRDGGERKRRRERERVRTTQLPALFLNHLPCFRRV